MKTIQKQKLLDLRNDVVFKLFFSKPKNKSILISFLETVLNPSSPIEEVTILNPTLPNNLVENKGSVLDLVIQLKDLSKIDVEMQVKAEEEYRERILYYWAKLHQSQLQTGDLYQKLTPTVSISVLAYNEFSDCSDEVHSIFELRERSRGTLYLPDMQLHFLELKKYQAWKEKHKKRHRLLDYWIRFFDANSFQENDLQEFRKESIMGKALEALEELSQEPSARELAEMREKARINFQIITSGAEAKGRAEGEAKGRAEGEAKGRAEGEAKGKKEFIQKAAKSGMSAENIAALFEMSIEEVKTILNC